MTDRIIREADQSDAALIAELTRDSWANKVASTSSGHREDVDRVIDDLRSGGGFILLRNEVPAGAVRWRRLDGDSHIWEICRMCVLPSYRGERLSQHLIEAVIHHALTSDIAELRLAVRSDQTRLLDLYAAFGFDLAPELEYTRANPHEPAPIVMRRCLR